MSAQVQITILADNQVGSFHARGEHGLAFWVCTASSRILFDTGQGLVLEDNARTLRADLFSTTAIVLSHGHYDHTGGLAGVLKQAGAGVRVFAHPDAVSPKYVRGDSRVRDIAMPHESREALAGIGSRFVTARQATEVCPGFRVTGEIPRRHPEEAITEPFCTDSAGREPDLLPDDQALFFQTHAGTVILLGCAHAGLISTLDAVRDLTNGAPIRAVIGGTHLRSASDERIAWTLAQLRRFKIPFLAPIHCTGQKASAALWTAFPRACRPCGAGATFEF